MDATREQLERWDVEHVWHPFTQMAEYGRERPLIIERAHGCYLVDLDGNEYLDGVSSLWCNVHGHRHPDLDRAVREQLDRVAHSTLLGVSNVPAIKLARKLVELAAPLAELACGTALAVDAPMSVGNGLCAIPASTGGGTPQRAFPTDVCDHGSACNEREHPGTALTRVFFSDDGATAVEVALKMAFQYWRQRRDPRPTKTKFLALGGAYHGDTLGNVSVSGVDLFHRMFGPLLFPTYRAPAPHCYRCPLGLERASCRMECLGELERLVAAHHEELAAVVIEPMVQGAAGMIVAPEGYLRGVRAITRRYGVLLIADEVAVGFGRTGTLFACEQEGVCPDFLCLAKGLTGGYLPLAATLTNDEVYSAFLGSQAERKTFFHGHTYSGNPLGAAVALASLEVFEQERVLENLPAKMEALAEGLARLAELPHVGDIRQKGLMAGVELVRDRRTKEPYDWTEQVGARVCRHARRQGLLIRPLGNVIVLMPPLAISREQIRWMCEVVCESIRVVTQNGEHLSMPSRVSQGATAPSLSKVDI